MVASVDCGCKVCGERDVFMIDQLRMKSSGKWIRLVRTVLYDFECHEGLVGEVFGLSSLAIG